MLHSANTIFTSKTCRGHILSPFSSRNALRRYCLSCISRSTHATPPKETSTFKVVFGGCRLDTVSYRPRPPRDRCSKSLMMYSANHSNGVAQNGGLTQVQQSSAEKAPIGEARKDSYQFRGNDLGSDDERELVGPKAASEAWARGECIFKNWLSIF